VVAIIDIHLARRIDAGQLHTLDPSSAPEALPFAGRRARPAVSHRQQEFVKTGG
jgi:hypothetical protein